MAEVKFEGGKELERILKHAGKGSVTDIDVGVFSTATYQDGTPVAYVYGIQEFGYKEGNIPERPTMRPATKSVQDTLIKILKSDLDPKTMVVTRTIAGKLGLAFQNEIQKNIAQLRSPANAESTIKAKKSDKPLIDTGTLMRSITFKVGN